MKELQLIQTALKAPKGQTNNFGKYKYRSCEDILNAVKPLLADSECSLTISDEIILIGDRYYIKATAKIYRNDGDKFGTEGAIEVTAYAREPQDKKGMDLAQLTGATSSYARKYALNGLFAIDDTKDADTMKPPAPVVKMPKRAEVNKALMACTDIGDLAGLLDKFGTKYGNLMEFPSGHPTKKSETWGNLFQVHRDRLNNVSPVNAKQTPEELQAEFDGLCDKEVDKETYETLGKMHDNNPSLQNQANVDRLLVFARDFD